MANEIVVTGGTGLLGTAVASRLRALGEDFLLVSRNRQPKETYAQIQHREHYDWMPVNLATGQGLGEALKGRKVVLHLASSLEKVDKYPLEVVAARQLVAAARQAGVRHLVYISIVGIDKIPLPYYKAKLEAESILSTSGIPFSILRATQFFPFVAFLIGKMAALPIGFVPKNVLLQPVDVGSVADRLVAIALSSPLLGVAHWGGPQVTSLGQLANEWCQHRGLKKAMVHVPAWGPLLRAFKNGAATGVPFDPQSQTWQQFLASVPRG